MAAYEPHPCLSPVREENKVYEWQECLQNATATVMPQRSGELSRFETSVVQGFNICYYRLGVDLTTLSLGA